jgi:membrane protease YdiL (CAAX protease family)
LVSHFDSDLHLKTAKRYAVIGLMVFAIDKLIVSIVNVYWPSTPLISYWEILNLETILFSWIVPLIIVFKIELRGFSSLGLKVKSERILIYILLAAIGVVLPAFFVYDSVLLREFLEQLALIGLAEEFFYRGYLMGRFCEWLGNLRGLLVNSFVFSLAHLIFIFSKYGFTLNANDLVLGFQTFMGGLILGYIYLKAGDIIPGSILHISLNMYL